MSRKVFTFALELILVTGAMLSLGATSRADNSQGVHYQKVRDLNLSYGEQVERSACTVSENPQQSTARSGRYAVGSALGTSAGIGRGVSVGLTWDDAQYTVGQGRHISHWWNGEYGGNADIGVHFGYRVMTDTLTEAINYYSGYNAYDASYTGGLWPLQQEIGCDLQNEDTAGWGGMPSLDVMPNGRVVMGAMSHLRNGFLGDGTPFVDNMILYQGVEFECAYDPSVGLNVAQIDSTLYRPYFLVPSAGNYSRVPQVATQWEGSSTIVHVLLVEDSPGATLSGGAYCDGLPYFTLLHYRKVGETSSAGTWSAGQPIDSIWFPWAALATAPYPHAGVAVTYTNPSAIGALLNNPYDLDVWLRESPDRGLTWQTSQSITDYQNGVENHPNHFTAWLESQALYSTDGDLHVVWLAKPTSQNPYFDGFNWQDFDANVYHWAKSTDEILFVANGYYEDLYDLCGDISTVHCGFGGSNAGYIANVNLSQCEDKLYCIWNQIHERANRFPWRCAAIQPAPGVLDDCSYTGNRLAKANWEIMMSVKRLGATNAWDLARNISNTYTPNCGLPGDLEAEGLCGSEYKPSVERYGFDEAGLNPTWPSGAAVDMTPYGGSYSGTSYLNLLYLDDQFPGPAFWGKNPSWTNPPGTLNSVKWIHLACVEPVEAPVIEVWPTKILWPEWVWLGESTDYTIAVTNTGNVPLNVSEIGFSDGAAAWLSVAPSTLTVPCGADRTRTFTLTVNATAITESQWLDADVWVKSDAVNTDSVPMTIHMLAADHVEPVYWDTVTTHTNMFDLYEVPAGECVALAVSNHGEMGALGGTLGWVGYGGGQVNLDYKESELDCGPRAADAVYLYSGSPFVILADDSEGSNARLTCSYGHRNQAYEYGWDPTDDKGSLTGGYNALKNYDSVYTGRFVNRDTTIAMERRYYAPRSTHPETDIINFVICHTKFYSADGQTHNHMTLGNVCDFDIPSELPPNNTAGVATTNGIDFVYARGTDTLGTGCQLNTNRFAAEAFGGGYTSAWLADSPCVNQVGYHSQNAWLQGVMTDTAYMRDGTPLVPPQPNPLVWWELTATPGANGDGSVQNQAIWLTYKQDYSLEATDTLHYWTVLTTVRNGTLAQLQSQVSYAQCWYMDFVRGCLVEYNACCAGRVGNANNAGVFYGHGDPRNTDVTIGDIQTLVTAKFIVGNCNYLVCLEECDVNQSAPPPSTRPIICSDITIGDIQTLVNHLFIAGPQSSHLKDCPGASCNPDLLVN